MSCTCAFPSFLVHLFAMLSIPLKQGTKQGTLFFGNMVIHSGYPARGSPLLCHVSEPHVHINGKEVTGAVTFPTPVFQST